MFIELTDLETGINAYTNINQITLVMVDEQGVTRVMLRGKDFQIPTKEPYETVKQLIAREVQAERGY